MSSNSLLKDINVTLLLAFPAYPNLSNSQNCFSWYLNFPVPMQCFSILALVQIPHTRQPGTERHSAYWMANRHTRNSLCQGRTFLFSHPPPPRHPKKMASESTSLSLKATHLLVSDCSCFPLQGAAHLVELWLRKQGKKCVDRGRDSL